MVSSDKRVQAYIPTDFYNSVELYAKHHGISVSKAVADLLVQGLANFSFDGTAQPLHPNSASDHRDLCRRPRPRGRLESRANRWDWGAASCGFAVPPASAAGKVAA